MTDLARMLGPLSRRIGSLVARGLVSAVSSTGKMQLLQLRLEAGDRKDRVEHFEPFGFTSKPKAGAEHVTLFLDGDRSTGFTIVVADRRYRVVGLDDGEAAMYDAYGNKAHFKKDGTYAVVASTKVEITSPLVTISGDLRVDGTITGTTDVIAAGKSGKSHTHPNGTPNTGTPNS